MFSIYKQIPTFHWSNKGDYAADYVKHSSECYFNEIYTASPLVLSLVPSCNSHDQQTCFSFLVIASQYVLILIYFPFSWSFCILVRFVIQIFQHWHWEPSRHILTCRNCLLQKNSGFPFINLSLSLLITCNTEYQVRAVMEAKTCSERMVSFTANSFNLSEVSLYEFRFMTNSELKRHVLDRIVISWWVPSSIGGAVSQRKQMQAVICYGELVLSSPSTVQAVACNLAPTGSPGPGCVTQQAEAISSRTHLSCHSHQQYGICMEEQWCDAFQCRKRQSGILLCSHSISSSNVSDFTGLHNIWTSSWQTVFNTTREGKRRKNIQ